MYVFGTVVAENHFRFPLLEYRKDHLFFTKFGLDLKLYCHFIFNFQNLNSPSGSWNIEDLNIYKGSDSRRPNSPSTK